MSADRFVAGHLIRRHWLATVVLGIGLGLAAAVPVTSWGIARRTDRAFAEFRFASLRGLAGVRGVTFCPEGSSGCFPPHNPIAEQQEISRWPEVRGTARQAAAIAAVSTLAHPQPQRTIVELHYDAPLMIDGELITESGRARLVAGRVANFDGSDEVMANEAFLSSRGATLGDVIKLGLYSGAEFDKAGEGAVGPSRGFRDVRIVGVIRLPRDLRAVPSNGGIYTDAGDLLVGRGVFETFGGDAAVYGIGLYILPKDDSVSLDNLLAERYPTRSSTFDIGSDEHDLLDATARSVHLQANSALAFAWASGLAALLFGGQSLLGQLRRELAMRRTLSAIGLGSTDLGRIVALRIAPIAALAAATSSAVAVLASPLGPIGIARRAELNSGIKADAMAVAVGAATLVAALAAVAAIAVRTASRRQTSPNRWASFVVSLSPSARAGLAFTRRAHAQRRAAVVACVAAAGSAVAALVLVTSLGALVAHPARYGFAWDAQVGNFGSSQQAADGLRLVRKVPHITGAVGLVSQDSVVEGGYEPLLAFDGIDGYDRLDPRVSDGRLPLTAREIALGRPLAEALHKRVGDSVKVTMETIDGNQTESLTLVGYALVTNLFPSIDPKNAVFVDSSLIRANGGGAPNVAQSILVRVDPSYRSETAAALQTAFPNTYATAVPPPDVLNLQRVSNAPPLLALVIGILAGASVLHALALIARVSRRDLVTFRALGASTRQARASLQWSASVLVAPAIVVGAVLGLIGGQIAWRSIAHARALDQAPTTPTASILVMLVVGVVVTNAAAWLPARRHTNTASAASLRSE